MDALVRLADRFGRRGSLLLAGLAVQAVVAITVLLLFTGGRDGGLPSLTPIAEAAAQFPGGRFEVEQVGEEGPGKMVLYMRSDAFGDALPGGAEWMKIDLSEDIGAEQPMDVRQWLGVLRSSHDLESLGSETIRGIPTTHYRATIDQSAEVDRLREEGQDRAADALETLIAANEGADTTEVEVWVGGRTVHRFRMTLPFSFMAPAGSTMQMTVDLFDFGVEPDIDLPDEGDVFDATDLAREGVEQLAD
jgi:hypothetical protein